MFEQYVIGIILRNENKNDKLPDFSRTTAFRYSLNVLHTPSQHQLPHLYYVSMFI